MRDRGGVTVDAQQGVQVDLRDRDSLFEEGTRAQLVNISVAGYHEVSGEDVADGGDHVHHVDDRLPELLDAVVGLGAACEAAYTKCYKNTLMEGLDDVQASP